MNGNREETAQGTGLTVLSNMGISVRLGKAQDRKKRVGNTARIAPHCTGKCFEKFEGVSGVRQHICNDKEHTTFDYGLATRYAVAVFRQESWHRSLAPADGFRQLAQTFLVPVAVGGAGGERRSKRARTK